MFDLQLLENNPNTPPFYLTLITVLSAFFLSSLIAITYEFTTKSIYKKAHFLQSLAMISIVAAMVMQAIGDSIATGLGMLGALAIVRFRTNLDDPRNITFMFASLATGIACGVFGLSIALVGTLVFCLAAIILKFSPLHDPDEVIGIVRLRVPKENPQQKTIEQQLQYFCKHYTLDELKLLNPKTERNTNEAGAVKIQKAKGPLQEFTYSFRLKNEASVSTFADKMEAIEGVEGFRLNFKNQPPRL